MNQNNNYKFSKKERKLFRSIANHIQANPKDYKEAGKWLDEYCTESAYWIRKKEEIEKLKEKRNSSPVLLHQQEVDRLEKEIKEKRTPASIIRFQEAQKYLLDNYGDQEFISKEVAAKVIIITWLLTDPDAEKVNLHITEFEKWKWDPLDDVFKFNRDFKGFLFAQNKEPWMKLVNIALEKIAINKKESTLKGKPPESISKLLWVWENRRKHWKLIVVAGLILFAAGFFREKIRILISSFYQKTISEAKTSGDSSPAINTLGPNSSVAVTYEEKNYYGVPLYEHAELMLENRKISESIREVLRELGFEPSSPNNVSDVTQKSAQYLRQQAAILSKKIDQLDLVSPCLNDFKRIVLHYEKNAPLYRVTGLAQLLECMAFALSPQVIYPEDTQFEEENIHFNTDARNFLFTKYCLYRGKEISEGLSQPVKQTFAIDVPQVREFLVPRDANRYAPYLPEGFGDFLVEYDSGRINDSNIVIIVSFMTNISLSRNGGLHLYPNLPWQAIWLKLENRNLLGRTMWFELRNPEHATENWISVIRWLPIDNGIESASFRGEAPFWDHQ